MNPKSFLENKIILSVFLSLFVTLISVIFIFTGIFDAWHLRIADTLYTRNEPSNDIVIIGIDDKSTLEKGVYAPLGRFSQWSRENYAKLLNVLEKENPKVIAFDILFHTYSQGILNKQLQELKQLGVLKQSSEERLNVYEKIIDDSLGELNHPSDNTFAEALKKFSNIVLIGMLNPESEVTVLPIPKFTENNPKIGIAQTYFEEDGVLRKVQPTFYLKNDNKYYDDFAVAAVKQFLGAKETTKDSYSDSSLKIEGQEKTITIPLEKRYLNVNFFAEPFKYKMVSFIDVINGEFNPDTFKDKIVLIGVTSFKVGQDKVLTPRSNTTPMSGVEFRANEIQTILDEKFLVNQSASSQIAVIFLLSLALIILVNYLGILVSAITFIILIAGYYISGHFFYSRGLILNMAYPFIAMVIAYIAGWIYKYFVTDKKKRDITSAFGKYVSEDLVKEISKNPDEVKLGGEKKVLTVLFSDLKGSTEISEKVEISAWVGQINEYFTVMESTIKKYGGTVDKYEGDAIMAFWNAPIAQEDHLVRAYMAALEMKKVLGLLNQKWKLENKNILEQRVGINSGEAIVGNFGSENRFDYTVMGDTVNVASRLESSANKSYGTSLMVAGFEKITDKKTLEEKIVMREVDRVLLPGKKEPVTLYELVCLKTELSQQVAENLAMYATGLALYREKKFVEAYDKFNSCNGSGAAKIMADRCEILKSGESIKEVDENMVYKILHK